MEQLQNDCFGRKVSRETINNSFYKYYVLDNNNVAFIVEASLNKSLFEVYRTIEGMAPYVEPTTEQESET